MRTREHVFLKTWGQENMFFWRHKNMRTCFFKTEVSVGGTVSELYHASHSIAPYSVRILFIIGTRTTVNYPRINPRIEQ